MPLLSNKELLVRARKGGSAIGTFSLKDLEVLQPIASTGETETSPAIIAVSEGAIQYAGLKGPS